MGIRLMIHSTVKVLLFVLFLAEAFVVMRSVIVQFVLLFLVIAVSLLL